MRPPLDIASPLPAQKPVDIVGAQPITLDLSCEIEWTPLEYDALEVARQCLWTRDWPQRTFSTCDCADFEVDPGTTPIPVGCYGDPRYPALPIDEIIFQRLQAILTAMAGDTDTAEPMRWGAFSALETMRADSRGLPAVRDLLFAQTGHEDVTITGCQVLHAHSRNGTIRLPARTPFTRCVDPDPATQPRPDPPYGPLPSWVLPVDEGAERLERLGLPAHLPWGLTGFVDPDPMRLEDIFAARKLAVRSIDRAMQRLGRMSMTEQLTYLQCQFDNPLVMPFTVTPADVPMVFAFMMAARTALNDALVGPAFTSHIELLRIDREGGVHMPTGFALWESFLTALTPRAITIGLVDRTFPETELPANRWWIALTPLWLLLDRSARAAVLAHEAFHLSNHLILDRGVGLFNAYAWESLVVDLAELHRIDASDHHCEAVLGDTRAFTCI